MKLSEVIIEKMIMSKKHIGELHKDDLLSQLHAKFTANGVSWYFIGTVENGERIRKTLGKYPAVDLKKARQLTQQVMIEQSITEIKRARAMPTFSEVLPLYLKHRQLKDITAKDYTALIERFGYTNKPINVTAEQFLRDYQQVNENAPTRAKHLARVVKALQRWASVYYDRPIDDATRKIKSITGDSIGKVNARERRLDQNQLATFWRVLSTVTELQRDAITITLITGLRFGELKQLTTQSIIHREGKALITIADTKNGIPQNLPLTGRALEIINRRLAITADNARLFPTEAKGAFIELKTAGVAISWHDLRRSWASFAINAGIPEPTIKRILNHSMSGNVTSKHYARIDLDTIEQALATVEGVIFT